MKFAAILSAMLIFVCSECNSQAPPNTLTLEIVSSSNQASVPLQKITLTQAFSKPRYVGALGDDSVSVIFTANGTWLCGNNWPMVTGQGNNPIVFTTKFKTFHADSNIVCHVY